MSLRKSSNKRKGSKSVVLPKPNARRRWTPAPSRVGLDLITLWTGRMDILAPFVCSSKGNVADEKKRSTPKRIRGKRSMEKQIREREGTEITENGRLSI